MSREGLGREQAAADPAEGSSDPRAGGEVSPAEGRSTTTETVAEEVATRAFEIWFDAERSARYHGARASFYDGVHRLSNFCVLILGSAALGSVMGDYDLLAGIAAATTAVLAAIENAFDVSGKARGHAALQGRLRDLAGQVDRHSTDDLIVRGWERTFNDILRDEHPAVYHALNALCHNQVCQAISAAPEARQKIDFWRMTLRNFARFKALDFPRIDEGDKARV